VGAGIWRGHSHRDGHQLGSRCGVVELDKDRGQGVGESDHQRDTMMKMGQGLTQR
jgi:hypothetical protein